MNGLSTLKQTVAYTRRKQEIHKDISGGTQKKPPFFFFWFCSTHSRQLLLSKTKSNLLSYSLTSNLLLLCQPKISNFLPSFSLKKKTQPLVLLFFPPFIAKSDGAKWHKATAGVNCPLAPPRRSGMMKGHLRQTGATDDRLGRRCD